MINNFPRGHHVYLFLPSIQSAFFSISADNTHADKSLPTVTFRSTARVFYLLLLPSGNPKENLELYTHPMSNDDLNHKILHSESVEKVSGGPRKFV